MTEILTNEIKHQKRVVYMYLGYVSVTMTVY